MTGRLVEVELLDARGTAAAGADTAAPLRAPDPGPTAGACRSMAGETDRETWTSVWTDRKEELAERFEHLLAAPHAGQPIVDDGDSPASGRAEDLARLLMTRGRPRRRYPDRRTDRSQENSRALASPFRESSIRRPGLSTPADALAMAAVSYGSMSTAASPTPPGATRRWT